MAEEAIDLRTRSARLATVADQLGTGQDPSGGGGGTMPPDLEGRIRRLEQDVAVIRSNYATKEDMANLRAEMRERFGDLRAEMHSLTRQTIVWIVGAFLGAAALFLAFLRYTLSAQ